MLDYVDEHFIPCAIPENNIAKSFVQSKGGARSPLRTFTDDNFICQGP